MSSPETSVSSTRLCVSSASAPWPSSPDSSLRRSCSPSSPSSSSDSVERSSPMSSASSRSWMASPKRAWFSINRSSRSRSRPARSSISGRHSSTSFFAAGGGIWPVSRSRTMSATASSIGASARSDTSSNLPRWKRSSSMAARFFATPDIRRAPIASTRACSTASNTARACCPPGTSLRCTIGSWQASLSAMASAWPRTIAASEAASLRGGSGKRALPPTMPGRSAAKDTSSAGLRAMARKHPVTARLNGSVGLSLAALLPLKLDDISRELLNRPRAPDTARSAQRHVHRGFRQLHPEAALIELGHDRPLQLVALVEEGEPEGKSDVLEDVGVLGPHNHRARAHDGRDVAVHESVARQVGDAHHLVDDVAALVGAIMLGLGEDDIDLVVVRQIVERGDDRPAVHLGLVDLLRAVIEAGRVTEPDRVRRGEQAEGRMRPDHAALVEQGQPAGGFQDTLDDEHHIGAAGVILVEAQCDIVLIGPWQDAVAELGHLHAVANDDGVLADQVDTADVAV